MAQAENFLHTTHRTVNWFRKADDAEELVLAAPFQRNPVWTDIQKAYLIDTILNGLPIPELYMQDIGNENGDERHVVVDGQQRIRAVLDFLSGAFSLEGDDVARQWRGLKFEELSADDKKVVFNYKFVVRILPPMDEDSVRAIFSRLNRNVVSLNDQELRNATYWGPFIKAIQMMADEDVFWTDAGIFSANDHRRMLDHEYISELAIAVLHGPQNKKDKLDYYYQLYEESFEDRETLIRTFRSTTAEISALLPRLAGTRWRKKSDFYTLFLCLAEKADQFPFSAEDRERFAERLLTFSSAVDELARLDEPDQERLNPDILAYSRSVVRAASDRGSRVARANALNHYVFDIVPPAQ
jgi:hypothetical protein